VSVNLDDFVRETLLAIIRGVRQAQEKAPEHGATINPVPHRGAVHSAIAGGTEMQSVEFDVAVSASEGTQTEGGIAVAAAILAVGSMGLSKHESGSLSRVRFTVPIGLPQEPRREWNR